MKGKVTTWRSYLFLISSAAATIAMFLLDPVSQMTNEIVTDIVGGFILFSLFTSVIMAGITFLTKREKKLLPAFALLITLFNLSVIAFLMYFGANFA